MTTLTTHDTKRSEDVRARLLAVAEDLDGWDAAWEAVRSQAAEYHVDEPTAYLLFQTLLGAWPLEQERLVEYMEKATHESKQFTSWDDPDERYEFRVGDFAARCLDGDVAHTFAQVLEANAATIRAVTLGDEADPADAAGRARRLSGQRDRSRRRSSIPTTGGRSTSPQRAACSSSNWGAGRRLSSEPT